MSGYLWDSFDRLGESGFETVDDLFFARAGGGDEERFGGDVVARHDVIQWSHEERFAIAIRGNGTAGKGMRVDGR